MLLDLTVAPGQVGQVRGTVGEPTAQLQEVSLCLRPTGVSLTPSIHSSCLLMALLPQLRLSRQHASCLPPACPMPVWPHAWLDPTLPALLVFAQLIVPLLTVLPCTCPC